jgi:hypothetical protein
MSSTNRETFSRNGIRNIVEVGSAAYVIRVETRRIIARMQNFMAWMYRAMSRTKSRNMRADSNPVDCDRSVVVRVSAKRPNHTEIVRPILFENREQLKTLSEILRMWYFAFSHAVKSSNLIRAVRSGLKLIASSGLPE